MEPVQYQDSDHTRHRCSKDATRLVNCSNDRHLAVEVRVSEQLTTSNRFGTRTISPPGIVVPRAPPWDDAAHRLSCRQCLLVHARTGFMHGPRFHHRKKRYYSFPLLTGLRCFVCKSEMKGSAENLSCHLPPSSHIFQSPNSKPSTVISKPQTLHPKI